DILLHSSNLLSTSFLLMSLSMLQTLFKIYSTTSLPKITDCSTCIACPAFFTTEKSLCTNFCCMAELMEIYFSSYSPANGKTGLSNVDNLSHQDGWTPVPIYCSGDISPSLP